MDDVHEYVADTDQFGVGKTLGPGFTVVIASNGNQWRDDGKLIEYVGTADVAAMNDVVAPHEAGACLRPQNSVRIRQQSNTHVIRLCTEVLRGGR
jgi:hypothetical protein